MTYRPSAALPGFSEAPSFLGMHARCNVATPGIEPGNPAVSERSRNRLARWPKTQ